MMHEVLSQGWEVDVATVVSVQSPGICLRGFLLSPGMWVILWKGCWQWGHLPSPDGTASLPKQGLGLWG